jgi:hypothetical protein
VRFGWLQFVGYTLIGFFAFLGLITMVLLFRAVILLGSIR